jgi:hypothetical protein
MLACAHIVQKATPAKPLSRDAGLTPAAPRRALILPASFVL